MSALRAALAAVAAGVVALGAAGCGEPEQPADSGITVEAPSVDVDDEPDGWDCERSAGDNERARKEQPDCGRYVGGKWVEWSWVAAGRTAPPAGWSEGRERASAPAATSAPRATKRPTSKTSKSTGGAR